MHKEGMLHQVWNEPLGRYEGGVKYPLYLKSIKHLRILQNNILVIFSPIKTFIQHS